MRNNTFRLLAAIALAVAAASATFAYDLIYGPAGARVTWDAGTIPFVIRMSQTANLQDGTSYATSVQAAMTTWNAQVTNVQFSPTLAAPGLATDGDGINEIAFDTKIYSNSTDPDHPPQDFGENVLAVTLSWTSGSPRGDGTYRRTQSDILFNSAWNWNSYRGNLQQPEDIRRVAIHELGHVLGLDHPDQDGQSVTAIMNASVSNIDSLQADDLTGAQLLYGRSGGFSPPRNDNLMYATPVFLNNNSATVSWTSIGATKESGEPHHGHSNDGASIWWKWTATANGTLTINTLGTNFDTVLAAYTGEYVHALTQLAANDDSSATERRSTITFNVTAGTTYSIAVAGWDSQWGIVVLNLSFVNTPISAPVIESISASLNTVGEYSSYYLQVSGSGPFTYQWERLAPGASTWVDWSDGDGVSGSKSAQLNVAMLGTLNGTQLRCVVSNSSGSATSATQTIEVAQTANALAWISYSFPGSGATGSVLSGTARVMNAGTQPWGAGHQLTLYGYNNQVAGTAPLVGIAPGQAVTVTLSMTLPITPGLSYACSIRARDSVSGEFGGLRSFSVSTFAAATAPAIVTQPQGRDSFVGDRISFAVEAVGQVPFSYQWYLDGNPIANATGSSLNLENVQLNNAGSYTVQVSNSLGSAVSAPAVLTVRDAPGVVSAAGGVGFAVLVRADGRRWVIGTNRYTQLGIDGNDLALKPIAAGSRTAMVAAARESSAFVDLDGALWVMGNGASQFVAGGQWSRFPMQVAGGTDVTAVSMAGDFRLSLYFIRRDGTLWGSRAAGNPVQVATRVQAVATGDYHMVYLREDGTVWGVSEYSAEALGYGSQVVSAPALVATGVRAIGAGYEYTMLVKDDGSLWFAGKLANDNITSKSGFTQLATGVRRAIAGFQHIVFIKNDGSAWAVGSGGALGDGTTISSAIPRPLPAAASIGAGPGATYLTKSDGSLWATGTIWDWYSGTRFVDSLVPVEMIAGGAVNPPAIPTGVSAEDGIAAGTVKIVWNHALAADEYEILRSESADPGTAVLIGRVSQQTIFYDRSAASLVSYRYWVRAGNGGGWSALSQPDLGYSAASAAPAITAQPVNAVVLEDSLTVRSFTVTATGTPAPRYRWQQAVAGSEEWTDIPASLGFFRGTTTATLQFGGPLPYYDAARYRCVVSNVVGTVTSTPATVTVVPLAPRVVSAPTARAVLAGSTVAVSVSVASMVPVTYQWLFNNDVIAGATSATLTLTNFQPADAGVYTVRVTNSSGSITASAIIEIATVASITTQPADASGYVSGSATFSVQATSNTPITYQWRKTGLEIAGATASSLTLTSLQASDAGDYSVDVTTIAGTVSSASATLTVLAPVGPVITQQPQSKTVAAQARTSFSALATGVPAPSYRWQRLPVGTSTWIDVVPGVSQFYTGETTPTLMLNVGTLLGNNGDKFRCIVSNLAGTATSDEATLTVTTAAAALLPAGGYRHLALLRIDASASATGRNQEGQFGDTTAQSRTSLVSTLASVVGVATGADHTAYLKADGTLWTTGYNPYGALGTGAGSNLFTPQQIASSVSQVFAGVYHTTFVKNDGTLWTAGWNSNGQLGDGTTTTRLQPVQVASDVVALGASYIDTMFVKSDATLWATGNNGYGQFGNGGTTSVVQPVQIATGMKAVALGYYHSLQLGTDGSLRAAGHNAFGQLGDGSTVQRVSSVPVDTGVIAVAAGVFHSVYLKSDGTAWAMGANDRGQLGDGSNTTRATPVQIATGVVSIGAGLFSTYVVKSDGSLWAAGANEEGQLGDGTLTDHNAFVLISSGGGSGLPADYVHPSATNSAGATRLALSWPHARGTLHYRLLRHTTNDSTQATVIADRIVGTYFTDVSAVAGVNYYYWVQPVNQFGALGVGASALGRFGVAGAAPSVTTPPATQAVSLGTSVTFNVVASGTAPLRYQWRHGGNAIDGATASSYSIAAAELADAGTYDVVVTNDFGSATSAVATLTVNKLAQTISFDPPVTRGFTTDPVALTATSSAGLPVVLTVVSGPASFGVGSFSLLLTNTGTVLVRATQAGDATHAAAAPVERSIEIVPAPVSVSFWEPTLTRVYNGSAFGPTALTTPAVPVTLTYDGSPTVPRNAGTYTVVATVSDSRYTGSATATYTIQRASQTIYGPVSYPTRQFTPPEGPIYSLAATLAGGMITYSVDSGSARVVGDLLIPTGAGTIVLRASSTGNANYLPPADVTWNITLTKAEQMINFPALADRSFSATPLTLVAASSSNLPVSFTLVSGSAQLSGNSLKLTGAGSVTVRASQAGNADYLAAPDVERTFTVAMNFDAWRQQHFSADELLAPAISGPNADPDGDSLANLVEYALGTDPRADSAARVPQAAASATDWTFTYTRPTDRPDITYGVEASTTLATWSSAGVTHTRVSTDNGIETWRATCPITAAPCFFRLSVVH